MYALVIGRRQRTKVFWFFFSKKNAFLSSFGARLVFMIGSYRPRDVFRVVLGFVIALIFLGYIRYASSAPPSFDGAMNLNTALSFVQGHGYGFVYNEFFPFPAQTDGPFTLPAGVLMWLGGVTPITTQGVNLAYLAGMIGVGFVLLRRMTSSFDVALIGCLILLVTPGLSSYAMGGFGEVPMLFWLLLSVAILAPCLDEATPKRGRLAFGGITASLCFLTKTVALLAVAPIIVLFIVLFLLRNTSKAALLLWFAGGLIVPIFGWEAFRLAELGGVNGYREWWSLQLNQALAQSGAGETINEAHGPISKASEHLRILGRLVGTPPAVLAIFLLGPWIVTLAVMVQRWRQRQLDAVFRTASLGAVSALYFIWWLVIERTEMAWLRRILDGLLLQQMLLVLATSVLIRAAWRHRRRMVAVWLAPSCLAAAFALSEISLARSGETLTRPPVVAANDLDERALAEKIRQLPADATLFGFGWWKAPVLALFSGRTMMNFYDWNPARIDALPHKYLVVDFFARSLAASDVQDIVEAGSAHLVADGPGGALYQFDKVLPYRPITANDENPAKLGPSLTPDTSSSAVTRGFYPVEGTDLWAKPNAALLLRRLDETRLSFHLYVPPQLTADVPGDALKLHVASANCLDAWVPVTPGDIKFSLPLACPPNAEPAAMRISLDVNGHIPNRRQIDADPRRLAYLAKDIQLEAR
jgi:hypothetical protein